MAEIKSSGSAAVLVSSDATAGVFGPWTAMFMGVDQATHPITFDSKWALLVVGVQAIVGSQFAGLRFEIELGIGPTSPPATIIWGPMRYTTIHTGGGRGNATNYSFPLVQSAGDQFWIRVRKSGPPGGAGVDDIIAFMTVSDQFQPVRPATVHFSSGLIFNPGNLTGVLFGPSNTLGNWFIMGRDGDGSGTPLPFNSNWLSVVIDLIGIGTTQARWQLGASADGNLPDLPELIDVGFQSLGQGGANVSTMGDVLNFPIPWVKGETVWIRGATIGVARTFQIASTFWGNP